MSNNNKSTLTILELVTRNLKFCGHDKTFEALMNLDASNQNELKEKILRHTLRICANTYGLESEELRDSPKKGNVKDARRMVWLLLKECIGMNNSQIAEIWKVSKQVVGKDLSKLQDVISLKDCLTKKHLELKKTYTDLKELVIIYKNNITDSL